MDLKRLSLTAKIERRKKGLTKPKYSRVMSWIDT